MYGHPVIGSDLWAVGDRNKELWNCKKIVPVGAHLTNFWPILYIAEITETQFFEFNFSHLVNDPNFRKMKILDTIYILQSAKIL